MILLPSDRPRQEFPLNLLVRQQITQAKAKVSQAKTQTIKPPPHTSKP
ncbi:hypothetical protein NWP17_14705 [Chrysosporum bergii ANA360D]|uniref:Uncharacterized protein n=1 Tax=Chrysosporum bergii ANA360D TaxID=617107 RepID=A0AA43GVB0_9CYAN|nr:hypothetical protein [Chrysosporum bergii]MDH6061667.1 hypothetical protein [Chrysosporum bergii ANA360D]